MGASAEKGEDAYALLYTGRPVYGWESDEELGKIKGVSSVGGRLEYEVEFKGGNVVKYDEHSLYATERGILLLPPAMSEIYGSLYELGAIWKRISELDDLFYSGSISEEKLTEQVADLLAQSAPLEERTKTDQAELRSIKEELDKQKKLVHEETLELHVKHLLNEVSDAERDGRLAELRKRNSFLNLRAQVFEAVLKKINEIQAFIRARTRIEAWRREGATGIVIKGTREPKEGSA